MADDRFFSTGNQPVELLLPLLHLDAAGFEVDIATTSGGPVKFEVWAFPTEDDAIKRIYEKYAEKLRSPLSLETVWGNGFTKETPYLGVFVPGGHGVLNDVPFSRTVGNLLRWTNDYQRYIITLSHGPACLLAADVGKPESAKYIFQGYKVVCFPDSLDKGPILMLATSPARCLGSSASKSRSWALRSSTMASRARFIVIDTLTGDSPLASNILASLLHRLCSKRLLSAESPKVFNHCL